MHLPRLHVPLVTHPTSGEDLRISRFPFPCHSSSFHLEGRFLIEPLAARPPIPTDPFECHCDLHVLFFVSEFKKEKVSVANGEIKTGKGVFKLKDYCAFVDVSGQKGVWVLANDTHVVYLRCPSYHSACAWVTTCLLNGARLRR